MPQVGHPLSGLSPKIRQRLNFNCLQGLVIGKKTQAFARLENEICPLPSFTGSPEKPGRWDFSLILTDNRDLGEREHAGRRSSPSPLPLRPNPIQFGTSAG